MNDRVFCNCFIITAIVNPKNRNNKAKAYYDTIPTIIDVYAFIIIVVSSSNLFQIFIAIQWIYHNQV